MSQADSLLRAGDIGGARAALIEQVKKEPANAEARMFLFQLFALMGEWTKARSQLSLLAQLSPEAQMLSVAYDQALTAEELRADVFAGKAQVPLLVKSQDWSADLARALSLSISGQYDAATEARDKAFDAAPDTPGQLDGVDFDWIADADLRFGPALEAIIAGQWGILPFEAIAYVKSDGPKDLRDIVWYPVQIGFRTGQSVAGFLPARYPGSEASEISDVRLARVTDWIENASGDVAIGQHVLNISDGSSRDLLSLRHLEFKA